jgi:hypothetical protein
VLLEVKSLMIKCVQGWNPAMYWLCGVRQASLPEIGVVIIIAKLITPTLQCVRTEVLLHAKCLDQSMVHRRR